MNQGIGFYHNFLLRFPDIPALASSEETEVLKAWQGLGYYSRARNMHKAARTLAKEFGGVFPDNYTDIRKLSGIGDYTAAAICSIAFNLPFAVVDGNVYRVLSRLFGIDTPIDSPSGKKEFQELADRLLDPLQPGEFNQALMEFGALLCVPSQPSCPDCPLHSSCSAFNSQAVGKFPVKSVKQVLKERYFNYLVIRQDDTILLEKRGDRDIWRNLYQLPLIETGSILPLETLQEHPAWQTFWDQKSVTPVSVERELVHLLTHQKLFIRFISARLEASGVPSHLISVKLSELGHYPIPKPVEVYLAESRILS